MPCTQKGAPLPRAPPEGGAAGTATVQVAQPCGKWWFDKDGLRWDLNLTARARHISKGVVVGEGRAAGEWGAEIGADSTAAAVAEEAGVAAEAAAEAAEVTRYQYAAQVHLNTFGDRPRMLRGVLTRDRYDHSFLPPHILRPVVGTFFGYGDSEVSTGADVDVALAIGGSASVTVGAISKNFTHTPPRCALQDTQDLEYADRDDEGLGYNSGELTTQQKEVVKMKNRRS